MRYIERDPSAALRPFVARLWMLEADASEIDAQPIPPDGHTEIIVHAGDPFLQHSAGAARVQERVLMAGQGTEPVRLEPRGRACIVGARLRPDAARLVMDVPQHELTDRIEPLSQVQRALARRIEDDVLARGPVDEMADALDGVLVRAFGRTDRRRPLEAAIARAQARLGLLRVDDLARTAGVGARQLERLFVDHVGVTPKMFLRIVRFQHVLKTVGACGGDARWAEIAAAHGFYDQAHFIRDSRQFMGAPPSAWQIDDASLTAMFSAIARRE